MTEQQQWAEALAESQLVSKQFGPGCAMYGLFTEWSPCPVGLAWGILSQANGIIRFDMWYIFVPPQARRHGVARKLIEKILECVHVIHTGEGSDLGEPFLIATGWTWSDEALMWVKKREPEPKPKIAPLSDHCFNCGSIVRANRIEMSTGPCKDPWHDNTGG